MTEKAVMVGMIVFYAVLIGICLFMLYQIYNALMELLREMLADAFEDGRKYAREKEKQERNAAGTSQTGTVLSGSYGRDAEEEEGDEWQKKKS